MELPAEFTARMKRELGGQYEQFIKSYDRPAEKAVRVNTLKLSAERFKEIAPFPLGDRVDWEENGFYVTAEGLGRTVQHAAGLYYVQEPSAMCAAPLLNVQGGERVLDLCAAPGGKGTQLAQSMDGKGVLFANEINFSRAKILSSNVERLGIGNAVVTCCAPEKLAYGFGEYFDKILVDAPCSGEGMFKKEAAAIPEWSPENVRMCAARQKEILAAAFEMLACGGTLVYSTCTFAPEEDELQIEEFIKSYPVKLIAEDKLYPHRIRGEGHFYAVLRKEEGARRDIAPAAAYVKDKKLVTLYRQWEKENLNVTFDNLHLIGDTLYSLPQGMPRTDAQVLRAGVRLGGFAVNRFEPSHSLAMYLKRGQAEEAAVDESTALAYLRGLTFDCGGNGWKLVTFCGYPLGWCKVGGGVAKNKLPKGLRI